MFSSQYICQASAASCEGEQKGREHPLGRTLPSLDFIAEWRGEDIRWPWSNAGTTSQAAAAELLQKQGGPHNSPPLTNTEPLPPPGCTAEEAEKTSVGPLQSSSAIVSEDSPSSISRKAAIFVKVSFLLFFSNFSWMMGGGRVLLKCVVLCVWETLKVWCCKYGL